MDLLKQQGFGELCCLEHLNPDSSQVVVLPMQLELAHGLAVHLQLPQLTEPLIVSVTQGAELSEIRNIPPGFHGPLAHHCHPFLKRARFSSSHCRAIMAAALLMRPSWIIAMASSDDTTWAR